MSGAQDGFSHHVKRAFLPVCCQPICLAFGFQIVVQNADDQLTGSHVFLDGLDSHLVPKRPRYAYGRCEDFHFFGLIGLIPFHESPIRKMPLLIHGRPKPGMPGYYSVGASLHLLNRLARSAGDTKAYLENFLKCVQKWTSRIFENL